MLIKLQERKLVNLGADTLFCKQRKEAVCVPTDNMSLLRLYLKIRELRVTLVLGHLQAHFYVFLKTQQEKTKLQGHKLK